LSVAIPEGIASRPGGPILKLARGVAILRQLWALAGGEKFRVIEGRETVKSKKSEKKDGYYRI
jgi:hypothetical protein